MGKNKTLLSLFGILILIIILSVFYVKLGEPIFSEEENSNNNSDNIEEESNLEGKDDSNDNNNTSLVETMPQIYTINGELIEVNSDELLIQSTSNAPLSGKTLSNHTIYLNDNTKYYYMESVQSMPPRNTKTDSSLSNLEVGQQIKVIGEDMKDKSVEDKKYSTQVIIIN